MAGIKRCVEEIKDVDESSSDTVILESREMPRPRIRLDVPNMSRTDQIQLTVTRLDPATAKQLRYSDIIWHEDEAYLIPRSTYPRIINPPVTHEQGLPNHNPIPSPQVVTSSLRDSSPCPVPPLKRCRRHFRRFLGVDVGVQCNIINGKDPHSETPSSSFLAGCTYGLSQAFALQQRGSLPISGPVRSEATPMVSNAHLTERMPYCGTLGEFNVRQQAAPNPVWNGVPWWSYQAYQASQTYQATSSCEAPKRP